VYWPEKSEEPFIPVAGSPLTIKFKSLLPFAEFVIRKMEVTHVRPTIIVHNCIGLVMILGIQSQPACIVKKAS